MESARKSSTSRNTITYIFAFVNLQRYTYNLKVLLKKALFNELLANISYYVIKSFEFHQF